jgi:hypothetical protein
MSRRSFRVATLVLGGLVVLGVSLDAATGGTVSQHAMNHLECVACSACAWVSSLLN